MSGPVLSDVRAPLKQQLASTIAASIVTVASTPARTSAPEGRSDSLGESVMLAFQAFILGL
jgi:hypothetical protein